MRGAVQCSQMQHSAVKERRWRAHGVHACMHACVHHVLVATTRCFGPTTPTCTMYTCVTRNSFEAHTGSRAFNQWLCHEGPMRSNSQWPAHLSQCLSLRCVIPSQHHRIESSVVSHRCTHTRAGCLPWRSWGKRGGRGARVAMGDRLQAEKGREWTSENAQSRQYRLYTRHP